MKKYFMLIITIFMFIFTVAAYKYENNIQIPEIKQPSISINSKKFGQIKNIIWESQYKPDNKALIILSTRDTDEGTISYLYHLNIDTGESELLTEFPAHKNLNNVVFNDSFNSRKIIAAYDKGIIKVNYQSDSPSSATQEEIEIPNFDKATSMDLRSDLIYTLENDNLLYKKRLLTGSFTDFNNNNNINDITSYYVKPLNVVNLNTMDNLVTYTSVNNNNVNLYMMKDGAPTNALNKPTFKDVISVQGREDGYGFAGMNVLSDPENNKMINLFMINREIDKYNDDDHFSLDTFPYNTDPFGAVPAMDSAILMNDSSLAYTSYDENHKGSLKLCLPNEQPKILLKDENIFGPIRLLNYKDMPYILYFVWKYNTMRIRVCNQNGNLVYNLTDMLLSA